MTSPFPIEFVQRQFPSLEGEWIFLDNAGGSQALGAVAERVREHLLGTNVQLGATYEISRRAAERVEAGRRAAARLVGAEPREVVLGPSTTRLLATLARSMVGRTLHPGDEVVVTEADHEANIGPWRRLEREGIRVRTWPLDRESLRLLPADLEPLLGPRTRLVAFTHCSNVLGSIEPVAEITRLAHAHGARVVVDGVAYAPHRAVDVEAWDVDFYALSLYKVYGPHQALLFGKAEHLLELEGQYHFFHREDAVPEKLEPGGVNHELVSSLPAIVEYLEALGREAGGSGIGDAFAAIAAYEERLAGRLLSWLGERDGVRVVGEPTPSSGRRVPTVSFVVDGMRSSQITAAVDRYRIGIRHGHFYAKRLVDALGHGECDGVVRVSMVHYNTVEEVERLIAALEGVLG